MRSSRVLQTIRDGKVARVLKLNTPDPIVAEVFAQSQPDAIWLCMEHIGCTYAQIEHQIRAAKIHDVDTLVRVPRGSYSDYVRPLELDAAGLIVPHIMGVEDATIVRDFTKFAPLGRRALDGGNADAQFTRVGLLDYLKQANDERFVCYQIEDPEAVADVEAIAAIEGVDCLFFGPGDYSVALGIPGQMNSVEVSDARRKVATAARKEGKIAATVCAPGQIRDYVDMGYNLLSVGADVIALAQYADKAMAAFEDL
jgi:4-hydroxy-2-oxoheptanedioate aldolase